MPYLKILDASKLAQTAFLLCGAVIMYTVIKLGILVH